MFILDDILLSPLKGLIWVADKVDQAAAKELYGKDNLKDKLMELGDALKVLQEELISYQKKIEK